MKKRYLIFSVVIVVVVLGAVLYPIGSYWYEHSSRACKERNRALGAREQTIKRQLWSEVPIGSTRSDAERFIKKLGVDPEFDEELSTIRGTIYTSGCGPVGCGSGAAIIGITVELDASQRVVKRDVISMYTDCV